MLIPARLAEIPSDGRQNREHDEYGGNPNDSVAR
jgi:hypothetical protein